MKKAASFVIFCLLTSFLSAQYPAPATREGATAYVNHLMNFHILEVEQKAPQGWSISAKPLVQEREADGSVAMQLHIFLKGAPSGTLFEEQSVPVGSDKPTTDMQGISLGKDGILMCSGRTDEQCGDAKKPDDPIEFTVQALKGEPYRFLFASEAGTIGIVIVPNPIADQNKGCTLSAVRLTPYFEVALITGTGFPPNTDVHYAASNNPSAQQVQHADAQGVVRFAVIPHPEPGQKNGSLKLKIAEPQCSPQISYNWGQP